MLIKAYNNSFMSNFAIRKPFYIISIVSFDNPIVPFFNFIQSISIEYKIKSEISYGSGEKGEIEITVIIE
jgi:hypothetical protein